MDVSSRMLLSVSTALGSVGPGCVIVGGSAHYLHARVRSQLAPEQVILRTNDVDVALEETALGNGRHLEANLLSQGFQPSYSGEDVPPATRYRFENRRDHWIEFIARNKGSARTASIAGVTAARLWRVELLLLEPLRIELQREWGFDVDASRPAVLWVANPACFLAQKLLALERRGSSRAKDIAYAFETLRIHASDLRELRAQWHRARPDDPKLGRQLRLAAEGLLQTVRDEHREAARALQAIGRADLDVHTLIAGLRAGIPTVFFEG